MKLLNVRNSVLLVVLLSFVFKLTASEPSPGYLDLNGLDRYVKIPQSDDFAIPTGGTMTITFKVTLKASEKLPQYQTFVSSFVKNDLRFGPQNTDYVGFEFSQDTYDCSTDNNIFRPIINVRYKSGTKAYGATGNEYYVGSSYTTFHVALIYDGVSKKLYGCYDGESMYKPDYFIATQSLDIPNYEGVLIGARYKPGDAFSADEIERFLNGQIDDVRFYRDALSEDDIKEDMVSKLPLGGKRVIAAYDFADLSEGKVRDISGNGHDGVLMGESWPEYEVGSGEVVDERPIVTIEQSEGGTVSVYVEGDDEVESGSRVEPNSEITVVAVPDDGYIIQSITVNGQAIEFDDEGAAGFVVSENSAVSAVFKKKASKPATEDLPDEDSNIWPGKLVLNGKDRYLRIPHDDRFTIQPNSSQTICFNVTLREDDSNRQTLIGSRSHQLNKAGQDEKGGVEIYIDGSGLHGLYVYNKENTGGANFNAEAKSSMSLPENINSHVALVHDGNGKAVRLYVDGVLKGEGGTLEYTVPVFSDILVGCRYKIDHETEEQVEYFAKGIFDDIHIYASALTPEQVSLDMEGKELPTSAGLIAAYDFTDFNGTEIRDVSGNGHPAYMMGTTWPEYTAAKMFAVNFSAEGTGLLTVTHGDTELKSGESVRQNETITIRAVADAGNRIKTLTVNGEVRTPDADGLLTVEVSEEISIFVVFEPIPADVRKCMVNVAPVEHAEITLLTDAGSVDAGTEFAEGTVIKINVSVDDGFILEGIYVNDVKIESDVFTVKDNSTVSVKLTEKAASIYPVKYTVTGSGTVVATVDDVSFESGQAILYGKTLVLEVVSEEGFMLRTVTINGEPLALGPNNRVEVTVDKEIDIEISFSKIENRFFAVNIIRNDNVIVKLKDSISEIYSGSSIQEGSEIIVTAIPSDGYEVAGIYVNNVKLDGTTFVLRGDCSIEVKVQPIVPKTHYPVVFKCEGSGSINVSCGDAVIDSGNDVAEGSVLVINSVADEGWRLKSITVNDEVLDAASGTDFEFVVNGHVYIYAIFEQVVTQIRNHIVTVEPVEHAKIMLSTSDGVIESGVELPEGTEVSIEVTVDDDYELEGVYINGILLRDATFTVGEATTITVKVKEKPDYKVSFTTRGDGSVKALVDDSSFESGEAVKAGQTLKIIITPDEGFMLESVTVNDVNQKLGPENRIEIKVDKDLEIIVTFSKIEKKFYDVKLVWNDNVTVKMRDAIGELSHSNSLQEGSEVTVSATPADGYELIGIFVNDVKLEGNTFVVRGHSLVEARVQPIPRKFTVEFRVDGKGTLEVLNGAIPLISGDEIDEGTVLTIKPIPAQGWTVSSLSINDEVLELSEDGIVSVETIGFVTIEAIFVELSESRRKFAIEIVQPENGVIKLSSGGADIQSGEVIEEGEEITVNVIPAAGYCLESILVNNQPISGNSFVLISDCAVSAKLVPDSGADEDETCTLTYTNIGPGHILVIQSDIPIESGTKLVAGTSIRIRCIADLGACLVALRVNGESTTTDHLGNADIILNDDTFIEAEFAMIGYQLVVNTSGDGRVELYREIDASGNPVGNKLSDTDRVAYGDRLHLFAIAEKDRVLMSASINNNGETKELAVDKDFSLGKIERSHYHAIDVKGDLVLDFRFSSASSGTNDVYEDESAVRYYNLHGIEIPADRLTPGIYIRVSGKTRQKVLIR